MSKLLFHMLKMTLSCLLPEYQRMLNPMYLIKLNILTYFTELSSKCGFFTPNKKQMVSQRVQMGVQSSSRFPFVSASPALVFYYVNESASVIIDCDEACQTGMSSGHRSEGSRGVVPGEQMWYRRWENISISR